MTAALSLGRDTGIAHLPSPLALEGGGRLLGAHVAFEVHGDPGRLPVVVVLGELTAGRRVKARDGEETPGWWDRVVGPGRALDTRRFAVVGIDWLGGRGASTGASRGPEETRELPVLSPRDQAVAVTAVLDVLGVDRARAVVGASYGGSVALAFAQDHPGRLERLILLSAAHRGHALAPALRRLHVARERARDRLPGLPGPPRWTRDGVAFPREGDLGTDGGAVRDEGADPALSTGAHRARLEPERVTAPTWVWAVRSDALVPLWRARELAGRLGGPVRLREARSPHGHDAFLLDTDAVAAFLDEALADEAA